jgi:DNA polymerase
MAGEQEELAGIAEELRAHLEWLRETGLRELPRVAPSSPAPTNQPGPAQAKGSQGSLRAAVRASVGATPPAPTPAPTPPASSPRGGDSTAIADAPHTLEEIRDELGACKRCKLNLKRRNIVFGVGSPKAELVFVGEGPGEEEDRQGIPFVGAAGQLLTKMIEAMGFSRSEVYICNVVKCRPPGNRNPEPDEIAACEPFLKAQLQSLKPRVIVTLGKFAAQTLLRESTAITRLRGKWREYCTIPLMPTFHPAYLLRQPDEKKLVWDDLQQVMKVFGRAPPAKKKQN